ncbi:MAG: ribose-5-phosphate isomerase RpiA [Burkholderiaceae bacterium]
MDALTLKRQVAEAALAYVQPGSIIGIGTGSTVDCFIDALVAARIPLAGAVSSSERSTGRLLAAGIRIIALNDLAPTPHLALYVDGADEIDPQLALIKGGGGALTREKIVASVAEAFVCIADASKEVAVLGSFPLPVEVVPMACAVVAKQFRELGGEPVKRAEVTDNGNWILDVHGLKIDRPAVLESRIDQWPGVVTNGIFARRPADIALIAGPNGIRTRRAPS